jgi:uncharacterized damage-inducible protein DinB
MTMLETSRMLARYNGWANDEIMQAVAALPEGEAEKERVSLFRNMVHTLNHNYVIGAIWQAHLMGREHGYTARNTPDHPPLDTLRALQATLDAWYIAWADAATGAELEEPVSFALIGGNRGTMTRAQILLHVVNHSSYHRGFVADMFFQVPARPPLMDLPVYLRQGAR